MKTATVNLLQLHNMAVKQDIF